MATGATLGFDATGGGNEGKLAGQILSAMEIAANKTAAEYSRYGSDTYKQVYIYGGLDPSGDENFLIQLMEGVEDIPGSALHEGIDWGWETFPEFLDVIDKKTFTLSEVKSIFIDEYVNSLK